MSIYLSCILSEKYFRKGIILDIYKYFFSLSSFSAQDFSVNEPNFFVKLLTGETKNLLKFKYSEKVTQLFQITE